MFFVGDNVLYVEGLQNPKDILIHALNNKCNEICLGYNKSFKPETDNIINDWNYIFEELIKADVKISLICESEYMDHIDKWDWSNYNKFMFKINVATDLKEIK